MEDKGGAIKRFYGQYHDRILDKRYNSPFWLRRYLHRVIYDRTLARAQKGKSVLDSGCGEGVLSILMAQKGAFVTGIDMSISNIRAARKRASDMSLPIKFIVADAENLPFPQKSFELVVSSHVLEHLPNPTQGLHELYRVAKQHAVIAMPGCLNPSAWVLLGGDIYWKITRRSVFALLVGFLRMVRALVFRQDGVQEGYAGQAELPHVLRFPWTLRRMIEKAGFHIEQYQADSILIPYVAEYVPPFRWLQMFLDRYSSNWPLRYLGLGCNVLCRKH